MIPEKAPEFKPLKSYIAPGAKGIIYGEHVQRSIQVANALESQQKQKERLFEAQLPREKSEQLGFEI